MLAQPAQSLAAKPPFGAQPHTAHASRFGAAPLPGLPPAPEGAAEPAGAASGLAIIPIAIASMLDIIDFGAPPESFFPAAPPLEPPPSARDRRSRRRAAASSSASFRSRRLARCAARFAARVTPEEPVDSELTDRT